MRVDWAISAVAHAGLLAWGLVSFTAKPFASSPESVPVDVVSATEYSQMIAGSKKAPKAETPKPLVEKVAETKLVDDPAAKISELKEIKEARAEPAPPVPEPRPKPPEPEQAKKPPQPKVDPIAEALKRDKAKNKQEAKDEHKQAEKRQPKKPEQPRFDPDQVAALLDKREPRRQLASSDTLSRTASLGVPSATAAKLSQSEMAALVERLRQLWSPPVGARNPDEIVVRVRIRLGRDGRLAGPPQVLTSGSSPLFQTARESAIRALYRGQPFDMLRAETYEQWKDIEINFDPREMMRG
jgi:outer membrane biosynthesis protein TonB